jgi:hypothetical protein
MAVDLRLVSDQEIDKLERHLRRSVDLALREENGWRAVSNTTLTCTFEMVGDRPSGETPVESDIVRAAMECSRQLGIEPRLDCSSTDSNMPISLGIPAITIGVGGVSGNCHCLTEWYEPLGRELGLKRLLLLLLGLGGRVAWGPASANAGAAGRTKLQGYCRSNFRNGSRPRSPFFGRARTSTSINRQRNTRFKSVLEKTDNILDDSSPGAGLSVPGLGSAVRSLLGNINSRLEARIIETKRMPPKECRR